MMLNLHEIEEAARQWLDHEIFDYYAGGSEDEVTLRRNRAVFQRIALRPRVLREAGTIALHTTMLGTPVALPIAIAPMAYLGLAHVDGETAVVKAAETAGALAMMSINASQSLEEIRRATSGPLWQQFYCYADRGVSRALLDRIAAAHYGALVVTVDRPRLGRRERDLRNGFVLRADQAANFAGSGIQPRQDACSATWEDIDWLRSVTALPLVLKGILTGEDAQLALSHGVSALILSNHGGRQLDGCVTGLEVLPEIVEVVDGRCEIYVDGGFRRGTDILKALALGARAVLIGRPIIWGLAVEGEHGVQHVLDLLRAELELAMTLTGCASQASITPALLFPPDERERERIGKFV